MPNNNAKNEKKSTDNKAVTGVEVVKDEKVVFEDGDFEEYNAEHDYKESKENSSTEDSKSKDNTSDNKKSDDKSNKDGTSAKEDKANKSKDADKEQKSDKKDKSDSDDKDSKSKEDEKSDKESKDSKSNKKDKASKKDKTDQDDKSGITMAGIYQWASKLKDDFTSDASGMTQDVSEKATAMMLGKLMNAVDLELAAFDKSLDVAKNLIETAEERRKKIAARKEKYQGMIDKLDQE